MTKVEMLGYHFRTSVTPRLVAPILRLTGYRFDKTWRWGETRFKRFVYAYLLCTFVANIEADNPGAVVRNPFWHRLGLWR